MFYPMMGLPMGMFHHPAMMPSYGHFESSADYLKSPPKIKFHENPIRFEYSNYKMRAQEIPSLGKSGGETPMFMPNKIYNMVF
jgi:hypothetical protein